MLRVLGVAQSAPEEEGLSGCGDSGGDSGSLHEEVLRATEQRLGSEQLVVDVIEESGSG